jgi:CRISPR-associated endonuclease/helicase Cas3
MIVILKSQCGKKALMETRHILDQFFERAGERSWEGPITREGLITVRKLLRKTARRNTAVACHKIRGTQQLELEWIVGNTRKFNAQGRVPTNRTTRDILRSGDENPWRTAEAIALLAGIAGLFHDFGKANVLFQKKLRSKGCLQEPLRHEWLSLLLFAAFVEGKTDQQWLQALADVSPEDDVQCQTALVSFQLDKQKGLKNPLGKLAPLAQTVGWLILSHHRLPIYPTREGNKGIEPEYTAVQEVELQSMSLESGNWYALWNSPQCKNGQWKAEQWQQLFAFPSGTPIASQTWCNKAKELAKRAQRLPSLIHEQRNWLKQDNFTSHLARLALMLADHSYSASAAREKWWDSHYKVFANTEKTDDGQRHLKQRLDEHNIGVGQNALLFARQLPRLRQNLPVLVSHKVLKARVTLAEFRWQDKAFDLARKLSEQTRQNGFFGVNMASTGKGKTFANARIMYGLASEQQGCRFSVALGLRTLTLQTRDALAERLRLDSDEMAMLVGSQAVQTLHRRRQQEEAPTESENSGSESSADLFDATKHISYDGTLDDGPLRRWLGKSIKGKPSKALQLLSAPVLVCTIDHLIPATEGVRGGKQIAPMLRLLTSDLVLDEPDDFDLADLPALCRLTNWAGLLGSRVLLSSASIPPVMATALFSAYLAGRKQFDQACGLAGKSTEVYCAWFDEFSASASPCVKEQDFKHSNDEFVVRRIKQLKPDLVAGKALRRGDTLPIAAEDPSAKSVIEAISNSCWRGMQRLHDEHGSTDPKSGKRVSIGLIRMANINPLVATALSLIRRELPEDWRLHLCVYHSQHPLLMRSHIEKRLDAILNRHQADDLWQQPELRYALDHYKENNQLFVVLGSPVTEVGRDHDYDWAIAEPSSIRSLIQLAGRVQRHRKRPPNNANVLVLEQNYKALTNAPLAYSRPGFEADLGGAEKNTPNFLRLQTEFRSIRRCVTADDLAAISSIPRIEKRPRSQQGKSLVDIEHLHLGVALMSNGPFQIKKSLPADCWWKLEQLPSPTWHAEIQRRTPFRQSAPEETYTLYLEDENEQPTFHMIRDTDGKLLSVDKLFEKISISSSERCAPWLQTDITGLIVDLAEDLGKDVTAISREFCEIHLRRRNDSGAEMWQYHPWLGVFRDLT